MRVPSARRLDTWQLALMLNLTLASLVLLCACSASDIPAGAIPTASSGDVQLSADHATYSTDRPVGITLTNGGQTDYYSVDGHSACTILQLQRYDSDQGKWLAVDGCSPSGQPRPLLIPAGTREPFTLAPTSATDPNSWQPGLYRVTLAYSANTDGATGAQSTYSAGFVVQG